MASSLMANIALAKPLKKAEEAILLQLANTSVEEFETLVQTHVAAMVAITGNLALYKAVALTSLASTIVIIYIASSRESDDNSRFYYALSISSAIMFIIYTTKWVNKLVTYRSHAYWNQFYLEMINLKGTQLA